MIRDPRAVSASLKKVPWNNQSIWVHIKRWKQSISIYEKYKSNNLVKAIYYESLVKDPYTITKDVCDFS